MGVGYVADGPGSPLPYTLSNGRVLVTRLRATKVLQFIWAKKSYSSPIVLSTSFITSPCVIVAPRANRDRAKSYA